MAHAQTVPRLIRRKEHYPYPISYLNIMSKSLSLNLDEDVLREVDEAAHELDELL